MFLRFSSRCLFFFGLMATSLLADEANLFGESTKSSEEAKPFHWILSGNFDVRAVRTGNAVGWTRGGVGITRYGAVPNALPPNQGQGQNTGFELPQLSVVGDVQWRKSTVGHLHLNADDHPDPLNRALSVGVVEAFGQITLGPRVSMRVGLFIPPISREHPEAGWATRYTLTPSALNTWVSEELRALGAEVKAEVPLSSKVHLQLQLAAMSHNDPATSILAWRGWALHDYQLKAGDRLRFAADIDRALTTSGWGVPFKEIDGRPGAFAQTSIRWEDRGEVAVFGAHNFADVSRTDTTDFGNDFAWEMRLAGMTLQTTLFSDVTLLAQGLYGTGQMSAVPAVKIDYWAAYALASYLLGRHRFTARYDRFAVIDNDNQANDPNQQKGQAFTAAYQFALSEAHLFFLEYLLPITERPGTVGRAGDPYDDLLQLGYRLRF